MCIRDRLEAGQSLRILAITDLHLGVNMDAARLKEICDEAEKQVLDLVVLGGDIFDESTSRAEMELSLIHISMPMTVRFPVLTKRSRKLRK